MPRVAIVLLLWCATARVVAEDRAAPQTNTMPQEVYVWQRAWTEPVRAAVLEQGSQFSEIIALAAEVTWKAGQPRVVRPEMHFPTLRETGRPVGLALRIGTFSGPFNANDERTQRLCGLANELIEEARFNQVRPAEVQIDFDCAESKLVGYRVWLETIRRHIAPVRLSMTVLPAWLRQPAFAQLASSVDGYVLQVHSLERPKDIHASFVLCDPANARHAVEKAGAFGVPFRVALPTYGYLVAFDRVGQFVGLSAEGPAMNWPDGVQLREVRADPEAMATLVATWNIARPSCMEGIIWYRLPVSGERRNWRRETLASVTAGKVPRSELSVVTAQSKPGLVEITLLNQGIGEHVAPVDVRLRWQTGRVIASDALAGFEMVDTGPNEIHFRTRNARLAAGQNRLFGWIRFDQPTDVTAKLESNDE